jgi:hypothetical protein
MINFKDFKNKEKSAIKKIINHPDIINLIGKDSDYIIRQLLDEDNKYKEMKEAFYIIANALNMNFETIIVAATPVFFRK